MTEPELREKFIELSAAQLKEFGVEGSPYLVNRFAVLVWKKLLPFTTQYGNQRELAGRIEELNKLDLNNNPGSCREDCSEVEHARHEGQYGHYLHIESYKNGRIAELKVKEAKGE